MRKCCFLSMDDLTGYVTDEGLLIEPFREIGWDVEFVSWQKPDENWSRFDAVVVRTTWNYHKHLPQFLEAIDAIDRSAAHLENPAKTIKWNVDKRYLKDLEARGIEIVPTIFIDKGGDLDFALWQRQLGSEELVVKPVVSATAFQTYRLDHLTDEARQAMAEKDYMIQPFLESVISDGEFSLFYFGGKYSHAILKRPKADDFRVQEDHGGIISAIEPIKELQQAAEKVIAALDETPLYARVDLIKGNNGNYQLIELELVEPSLYFRYDEGSPTRFAQSFAQRMNEL